MVYLLIVMAALLPVYCSLIQPQTLPAQPVVVITFDDAHQSVYSIAFPVMNEADPPLTATHFFPVEYIGVPGFVTLDQLKAMERSGWESGGHCMSHVNLTVLPADSMRRHIEQSFEWLKNEGLRHESFAFPWGNYTTEIREEVARYFRNIRTSHDLHYADGVQREELGYFIVKWEHSSADLIARVEQADHEGAPLVIVGFHALLPDTVPPLSYMSSCRESVFREFCRYLRQREYTVVTVDDAMKILVGE